MKKLLKAIILNLVVIMMPSNSVAGTLGTGSISVLFPLESSYMNDNNITLGWCDENKKISPPNIHNGIDISVEADKPVKSICKGRIYHDNTKKDYGDPSKNYWNSFLIIEHNCNGQKIYGYYGHIYSSDIKYPNNIDIGQPIGTIRHDITNQVKDHLHLSVSTEYDNRGWGYVDTCNDAKRESYHPPLSYLTFKSNMKGVEDEVLFDTYINKKMISSIKNSHDTGGCGCVFQSNQKSKKYYKHDVYVSDYEKDAWMNINGSDVKLKLSGNINQWEILNEKNNIHGHKYSNDNIYVKIDIIETKKSNTDEGVWSIEKEIYDYSSTITVIIDNYKETITAIGFCGC
jgi:hypothetical protein